MSDSVVIMKGKDFLRLAKEALLKDDEIWSREQAVFFIVQSDAAMTKSASNRSSIPTTAIDTVIARESKCDVAILWDAVMELESFYSSLASSKLGRNAASFRLARDVGVVLATLLAVFIGYRRYHDYPINLWQRIEVRPDFGIIAAKQGYGQLQFNKTVERHPIKVGGVSYEEGWGTHADSEIIVALNRDAKFFSGACGYPDSAVGNEIKCSIWLDSKLVWSSQSLSKFNPIDRFRFELNGNKRFTLKVNAGPKGITAAHAVWVELRLTDE